MQPPKSIKIKNNKIAKIAADIPNLPTQQLFEKNKIVSEVITENVMTNQTFFPKSIHLEDLDGAFFSWVKNFNFILNGDPTPVHFFTLQRFSEFMQTWGDVDEDKHPRLPLITITKETPAKKGTLLGAVSSTLPSGETFPLYKIPKIINGKTIYEYVEVPQPTFVDLQYKINIFTNHLRELNVINEVIIQEFKKPQNSISVFEHNMELHLNDISEGHKKDIEERRYYRQMYVIDLKAFILDEKDFKVKRSVNSISMNINNDSPKIKDVCEIETISNTGECNQCIVFNLNKKSSTVLQYTMFYGFIGMYDNQSTLHNNVSYFVNNIPRSFPFTTNIGDILKVVYNKNISKPVQIKLCGMKL
jgi:hypothetical protein